MYKAEHEAIYLGQGGFNSPYLHQPTFICASAICFYSIFIMSQSHQSHAPTSTHVADSDSEMSRCTPVAGKPGIVTSPELLRYHLGIVTKWDLMCCLTCEKEDRMVNAASVREHVKKHIPDLPRKVTRKSLLKLYTKYNLKTEQVSAESAIFASEPTAELSLAGRPRDSTKRWSSPGLPPALYGLEMHPVRGRAIKPLYGLD
jgi:hypothetical protein